MTANITEAYYSSVSVIIDTMKEGLIDVSEDVQSCTVNRVMDGVSSATITLTNYSNYKNGRYNSLLHIGDRVHVAFVKDSTQIDELTGRIFQVPVITFNEGDYTFTVYDVINDLQYMYWDPYGQQSIERYSMNFDVIDSKYLKKEGYNNDSGIGIMLKDFLSAEDGVCHMSPDAVKISKFPDTSDVMKNIINAALGLGGIEDMSDDEKFKSYNLDIQKIYAELFGGGDYPSASNISSSENLNSRGQALRDELLKSKIDGSTLSKILKNLVGFADTDTDYKKWDEKVKFKVDGKWVSWREYTRQKHDGQYGLTSADMKKYGNFYGDASSASASEQTKVINALLNSYNRDNAYKALWYYFNGWSSGFETSGKINYKDNPTFKIGNIEFKDWSDWVNYVDLSAEQVKSLNGNVKTKDGKAESSSKEEKTKSKDVETQSKKNKDNALAASFGSWVNANMGKIPTTANNGYSIQCWNLWNWYYQDFLKLDTSQFVRQPGGHVGGGKPSGNDGFAQYALQQSAYYRENFELITDPNKLQAGDVCFWDRTSPNNAAYGHVSIYTGLQGDNVVAFGQNPSPPNIQSFEKKSQLSGALRPKKMGGVPGNTSNVLPGTGTSGSYSSSGGDTQASYYGDDDALKLFKFINFGTDNTSATISNLLTGSDTGLNMANDVPCLDYVSSCCKASMRSFMSLPDGSFAAFVPDWWGMMMPDDKYHNVIDIPRHEVISFKVDFDKSSYVSHFFLTTNEYMPDPYGIGFESDVSNLIQLQHSSGVITMQYQGANLLKVMDISCTGLDQNDSDALNKLMQRWGVSVKQEHDEYIQDSTLTAISALYRFLNYWANCFKTRMQITFRPEIMPGLRLRFADAGVTVFVQSVTHSWNAKTGGTTVLSVNSPVTDDKKAGVAGS